MKPFVYEKVIKDGIIDRSVKLITRTGKPARIVCTNLKGICPIGIAILINNNSEALTSVTIEGKYAPNTKHDYDIFIDDTPIDFNKPIKTRNGYDVRILCTDQLNSKYPVIALIRDTKNNTEVVASYNLQGCRHFAETSVWDLVNVE